LGDVKKKAGCSNSKGKGGVATTNGYWRSFSKRHSILTFERSGDRKQKKKK